MAAGFLDVIQILILKLSFNYMGKLQFFNLSIILSLKLEILYIVQPHPDDMWGPLLVPYKIRN
jgi:hypothetical protein